jgi:hypothetical protein
MQWRLTWIQIQKVLYHKLIVMSIQNGDVVILQIGGVQVGALVSNSLNATADMLDKTNKDAPGIKAFDGGEYGWALSLEALFDPAASEGMSEALGYLKAGTTLAVLYGVAAGDNWSGSAFISSVDLSGPKNEISSYSLEIQGTSIFGAFGDEYQAVYNAMTNKPSAAVATAQNTMVATLVAAGIWSKLDVFYLFAQESNAASEALINFVNPGTFDATLVNSVAFVSLEGFTSNGTSSYINTNWDADADGSNFLQDDASLGLYIRTNLGEGVVDLRAYDGADYISLSVRDGSDVAYFSTNQAGNDSVGSMTDSRGMWVMNRVDSTDNDLYRNGSSVDDNSTASTGKPGVDLYIGAANQNGTPTLWSNKQYSVFFSGGSLTPTEITNLTNAIEAYMDSNSKGVIA